MDLNQLTFSFETVRWLITAVIGFYAWLIGRQSASAKELLELRSRLIKLETDLINVPRPEELHEVAVKLERIDARMDGVIEAMKPIARSLDRVNDYLLQHK